MKSADLVKTVIIGAASVDRNRLRDGRITQDDWDSINKSLKDFEKLRIIWNENAGLTSSTIR